MFLNSFRNLLEAGRDYDQTDRTVMADMCTISIMYYTLHDTLYAPAWRTDTRKALN